MWRQILQVAMTFRLRAAKNTFKVVCLLAAFAICLTILHSKFKTVYSSKSKRGTVLGSTKSVAAHEVPLEERHIVLPSSSQGLRSGISSTQRAGGAGTVSVPQSFGQKDSEHPNDKNGENINGRVLSSTNSVEANEVPLEERHIVPPSSIQGLRSGIYSTQRADGAGTVSVPQSTGQKDFAYPNDKIGENITLDDIFITVKTSGKYHQKRLIGVILRTWWNYAKNQTYFVTDTKDDLLSNLTGGRVVVSGCGNTHNRDDLCCKTGSEYDAFIESGKKWWCHMDDDNYLNVNALLEILRQYDWKSRWYIGRRSLDHLKWTLYENKKIFFWFLTGGAGVCISKPLSETIGPWLSKGQFLKTCKKYHNADDVILGFVINKLLEINITERKEFNSHIQHLDLIPSNELKSQVTLSYSGPNFIKLDEEHVLFTPNEDPTRLLSYHCLLYPNTDWCMAKKKKSGEG